MVKSFLRLCWKSAVSCLPTHHSPSRVSNKTTPERTDFRQSSVEEGAKTVLLGCSPICITQCIYSYMKHSSYNYLKFLLQTHKFFSTLKQHMFILSFKYLNRFIVVEMYLKSMALVLRVTLFGREGSSVGTNGWENCSGMYNILRPTEEEIPL